MKKQLISLNNKSKFNELDFCEKFNKYLEKIKNRNKNDFLDCYSLYKEGIKFLGEYGEKKHGEKKLNNHTEYNINGNNYSSSILLDKIFDSKENLTFNIKDAKLINVNKVDTILHRETIIINLKFEFNKNNIFNLDLIKIYDDSILEKKSTLDLNIIEKTRDINFKKMIGQSFDFKLGTKIDDLGILDLSILMDGIDFSKDNFNTIYFEKKGDIISNVEIIDYTNNNKYKEILQGETIKYNRFYSDIKKIFKEGEDNFFKRIDDLSYYVFGKKDYPVIFNQIPFSKENNLENKKYIWRTLEIFFDKEKNEYIYNNKKYNVKNLRKLFEELRDGSFF